MTSFRHLSLEDYDRLREIIPDWNNWKDVRISSFKIPMENIKERNDILNRCPVIQR